MRKLPRAPDPRKAKAKQLYIRGYKLIEIAKDLGIPPGTVRRWKHEGKWDEKRSKKKGERSKKKNTKEKEGTKEDVKDVLINGELNDRQRLFCIYYIRCFNATKAYKKAYGCKYESAMVGGCNLLRHPKIKEEIERLKQNKLNREMLKEEDIFQKYMDIAFSDITDYIEFGTKDIPAVDKEGKMSLVPIDYINIKNSDEIDGTLITEITPGKYGTSIRLADKFKALEWLSSHMDMATKEQKIKIEKTKAEIELLNVKKEEAEQRKKLMEFDDKGLI